MLILSRKINESIIIDDNIELSIVDVKGDQVKIGIDAPKNIKVFRKEVYQAIQEENRAAARSAVDVIPSLEDILKKE
ncbi:MAG: carbon storage regulator CsrA [Spirochaetia bacterium]|jgi:carbon storage regulator|nr:carbon storage regulator CsrA [Spirochaetia bacterium]